MFFLPFDGWMVRGRYTFVRKLNNHQPTTLITPSHDFWYCKKLMRNRWFFVRWLLSLRSSLKANVLVPCSKAKVELITHISSVNLLLCYGVTGWSRDGIEMLSFVGEGWWLTQLDWCSLTAPSLMNLFILWYYTLPQSRAIKRVGWLVHKGILTTHQQVKRKPQIML